MNKVLIFLPVINIYPYLRTLCCVARAISKDIYIIHSSPKSFYNKTIYCNEFCNNNIDDNVFYKHAEELFQKAKSAYALNVLNVDDVITENKINELRALIPEDLNDMISLKYRNIDIGKISLYDFVLKTKILDIKNISAGEKQIFYNYILSALVTAELSHVVCNNLKPDMVIAFNPYSYCQVMHRIAKKNKINFIYVTGSSFLGADFSQFILNYNNYIGFAVRDYLLKFPSVSSKPILAKYVDGSWKDVFFRCYGSDGHIFSSAKTKSPNEILNLLNLNIYKKTIVAFTSSNDEMIAARASYEYWNRQFEIKNLFDTQVDWIQFLKEYAEKHKDIQIIVRVHPREGNRQNGKPSEHLLLLQKTFTERTDNFVIIWADDPISSYDLLELADLCLVNWSTMGQECARVGIPVLTYTSGAYYVNSKSFTVAKTKQEYEEKLTTMLNQKYTLDILIDAIRYNYWRNHINVIDCSDTVPHDFNDESVWPVISSERASVIKDICLGKTTALEYNKERWLSSINENTEKEEKDAVLSGISDFFFRVFTAKTRQKNRPVWLNLFFRFVRKFVYLFTAKRVVIDISFHPERKKIHYPKCMIYSAKKISAGVVFFTIRPKFALLGKGNVQYAYNGKLCVRWSPLLYKLGTLYKDN